MKSFVLAFIFLVLPLSATLSEEPNDNPDLPQVLIIGDSISIGYTPHVREMLKGEAIVKHNPGNARHTGIGMKKIDAWLGKTEWDVIHFNWGLHDLCYRNYNVKKQGHRDKANGKLDLTIEEYEENLEKLVQRLEQTDAKLIWAETTVVPEGEAGRIVGDDLKYNEVAEKIMKKHNIPITRLSKLSHSFESNLFVGPGNVHFTKEGSKQLAEKVVENIRTAIEG